jgi:uracil-DNA glycosylase
MLEELQEQIRKMRLRGVTSVALSEENRLVLGHRPTKRPVAEPAAPVAMPSQSQKEEMVRRFQQAQQQAQPQPRTVAPALRPAAASHPALADVSQASWEELERACGACVSCGLQTAPRETFFEVGCRQAPLMVIGDCCRKLVDETGAVVESAADVLLWKMIRAMGRDPGSTDPATSVYVANVVKCVIKDELIASAHRSVRSTEIQACRGYLLRQIVLVHPRVIVLFGGVALSALFGKGSIKSARGMWREFQGIPVMPTYHPSYVLNMAKSKAEETANKRLVWQDLQLVMAKLKELQS